MCPSASSRNLSRFVLQYIISHQFVNDASLFGWIYTTGPSAQFNAFTVSIDCVDFSSEAFFTFTGNTTPANARQRQHVCYKEIMHTLKF